MRPETPKQCSTVLPTIRILEAVKKQHAAVPLERIRTAKFGIDDYQAGRSRYSLSLRIQIGMGKNWIKRKELLPYCPVYLVDNQCCTRLQDGTSEGSL